METKLINDLQERLTILLLFTTVLISKKFKILDNVIYEFG